VMDPMMRGGDGPSLFDAIPPAPPDDIVTVGEGGEDGEGAPLCPYCGAKMVEYRHTLNVGLCVGLKRLGMAGGRAHLKDLRLTYSQRCNFQKLRYWGLVENVLANDRIRSGVWALTPFGERFLTNSLPCPMIIVTYRAVPVRSEWPARYAYEIRERRWWELEDYVDNQEPH